MAALLADWCSLGRLHYSSMVCAPWKILSFFSFLIHSVSQSAYDHRLTIPHFYLSRAYLALAEEEWQDLLKTPRQIKLNAPAIRRSLRKASHHWNIANRLDRNRRLAFELRMYHKRIDDYTNLWQTAHLYIPPKPETSATKALEA